MADAVLAGALTVLAAVGLLLAPPVAASVVLHWSERRIACGLMRLTGRWAVLLTGWLGVPIHELSHALLCLVFRHRIEKIVLFHPDPKTGTLGYVNHAWDRRNPWQVVGTFFIGVAPLVGGAAAILLLFRALLPGVLSVPEFAAPASAGDAAGWSALGHGVWGAVTGTFQAMFSPANVSGWRLWVFLYLTLCVGSHVSPSPDDLRGGLVGGLAVLAALVIAGGVAVAAGEGGRLAGLALTGGVAVGLLLALVAVVNVPLALLFSAAGRVRG
jgi:hypothetical protein